MVRFYQDAFAAEYVFESPISAEDPRMAIVDVGGKGRYVKIVETATMATDAYSLPANRSTSQIERCGLAVDNIDQLRSLRRHIQARGIAVGEIERIPTQWILSVHDPDGLVLQVSAHVQ